MAPEIPSPTGTIQRWLNTYIEYITFVHKVGALPTETRGRVCAEEARLASWGRYQRRRLLRGTLLAWQKALLEEVPEFSWEGRWAIRCARLSVFLAAEGRMPRYRSSDQDERQLAGWVHKQRHAHRAGRLRHDRVEALRRLPFRIL